MKRTLYISIFCLLSMPIRKNRYMKKQIFCFISFLLAVGVTKAQTPLIQVDSLVNEIRREVRATDDLDLFKVKLDADGYYLGDSDSRYKWLVELYYDSAGNLKKTVALYDHDDESCVTYYNDKGIAVYTSYYICGMNGLGSSERYLDENGELLYVHHVSRDDWWLPSAVELISLERIIRRASPRATIPEVGDKFYDNVRCINDFKAVYLEAFDPEGQRYERKFPTPPEDMKCHVRFTMPKKGDITSLTQNEVAVYKKPTRESRILFTLDIRRDIEITGIKGDWYKISINTYDSGKVEGYIHREYIAPVEKLIRFRESYLTE